MNSARKEFFALWFPLVKQLGSDRDACLVIERDHPDLRKRCVLERAALRKRLRNKRFNVVDILTVLGKRGAI